MTKRNIAPKGPSDNNKQAKAKPPVAGQLDEEQVGLTDQSGELISAAGSGSDEAQAAMLGNPHLHRTQQQALAAQIGQRQGNRYLQRIISLMRQSDGAGSPLAKNGPGALAQRQAVGGLLQRKVVKIDSEEVDVADDKEEKEAKEIIKRIKENYGIDLSSPAGVEAIKKDYPDAPDAVKKGLKTKAWKFKELKALEKALAHFAPILGKQRKDSSRQFADQEITSASKVHQAIDENTPSGVLDTTTLGEYFESSRNFSMFTAGEESEIDFPGENKKQLEGTAIHEIAHGLLKYALPDYVAALDYWTDANTASGKADAEAPITNYGATNASEDLSEAVMFYFVEPSTLKSGKKGSDGKIPETGTPGNPCPKRHAFIEKMVKDWSKKPKGDFVVPQGNTASA